MLPTGLAGKGRQRKEFFLKNFPMSVGTTRDYYGRNTELGLVKNALLRHNSCIVVGERQSGNTSTLQVAVEQFKRFKRPNSLVLVINQQSDSALMTLSFNQFAKQILGRLEGAVDPDFQHRSETEIRTVEQLEEALLASLKRKGTTHCALYIDEFDSMLELSPRAEAELIFEFVSKIISKSHHLPLVVMLTMNRVPNAFTTTRGSPTINHIQMVKLRALNQPELRAMLEGELRGYLTLQEEQLNWFYMLSGGHPYCAKLLLDNFVQVYQESTPLSSGDLRHQVLRHALRDVRALENFTNIYKTQFQEDEKFLLLLLAQKQQPISFNELKSLGSSYITAANILERRGYFVKKQEQYDFQIHFWGAWLREWESFEEELERLQLVLALREQKNKKSSTFPSHSLKLPVVYSASNNSSKFEETLRGNFLKKQELITLLLSCPSIANRASRDNLLRGVHNGRLIANFARNEVNKIDVENIVNTLLDYPGDRKSTRLNSSH